MAIVITVSAEYFYTNESFSSYAAANDLVRQLSGAYSHGYAFRDIYTDTRNNLIPGVIDMQCEDCPHYLRVKAVGSSQVNVSIRNLANTADILTSASMTLQDTETSILYGPNSYAVGVVKQGSTALLFFCKDSNGDWRAGYGSNIFSNINDSLEQLDFYSYPQYPDANSKILMAKAALRCKYENTEKSSLIEVLLGNNVFSTIGQVYAGSEANYIGVYSSLGLCDAVLS